MDAKGENSLAKFRESMWIRQVADGNPYVNHLAHFRGLIPKGCRGTDPADPAFTGPIILPHPSVLEGSMSSYETKQLSKGDHS